ncbi:MAG TPA: two-component regulator propeller domain-containing protein, partial [Bacteroidia bacterium]
LGGGVIKYDGENVMTYLTSEGLISNTVYSILEDKKGNMWFGTDIGLTKFDGKDFINYTDKDGLSNNTVMSILEDKKGNLWFGTYGGGVTKYDGKYFTPYTEKEGLSNNIVWSIAEDKNGNIWFGTENGISCFVWEQASVDPEILIFHKQDGLKSEDFLSNSILLDSKNQLWMGSGRALTMLDLNKFNLNKKEPVVQLNNVMLQENFVDFQDLNASSKDSSGTKKQFRKVQFADIARFHNYPTELILPYNVSHLTFNFSAIDWSAPHKIKYQYQLQGLDPDWNKLTTENKADYRNIPYGNYTFKIKAIGDANKWSNVYEYSFTILPPFWHTWWFRILMAILLGLMVYGIFRWRTASLRKKQKELEQQIDLATEDIKQQKHEIEEKHKEITDSINYAERIQRTFLATNEVLDKNLQDYFVFFKPKDVVSGDFFWAEKAGNNKFVLVTADSTGHGVPGAIMSLLNITSLEWAIKNGHTEPAAILNETRKTIIDRLKRDGSPEGGKDGMDCIVTLYDFENKKLVIAAANNPVWIVRGGETIEIKPDKMPVGKHDKDQIPFTQQEIELQKGDVVYTLTDGFPDQFGGVNGKKFMSKNLRQFLANNAHLPMAEQKELLETTFINWMGNLEQIDDVTLIGVRV